MNHMAETTTDQPGLPPEDDLGWWGWVGLTERSPLKVEKPQRSFIITDCINQAKHRSILTLQQD